MTPAKTRLERVGDVHVLTLADPDKRNAIGHALATELVARAESLHADPDVRALVVTGEGRAFSAGADIPEIFGTELPTDEMQAVLQAYYACFLRIRELPFPTFAAVNGPAIGAGLNLALACSIRIAAPAARFGATFTRIGLHPGGGCSSFLVDAIGRQRALQLLLEGAVVDGEEAVRIGLALALDSDPVAAAVALAANAAALDQSVIRDVVTAVRIAAEDGFDATLEFESRAQAASTHSERFRAFVASFD